MPLTNSHGRGHLLACLQKLFQLFFCDIQSLGNCGLIEPMHLCNFSDSISVIMYGQEYFSLFFSKLHKSCIYFLSEFKPYHCITRVLFPGIKPGTLIQGKIQFFMSTGLRVLSP